MRSGWKIRRWRIFFCRIGWLHHGMEWSLEDKGAKRNTGLLLLHGQLRKMKKKKQGGRNDVKGMRAVRLRE